MAYLRKSRIASLKKYLFITMVVICVFVLSAAGYSYKKSQAETRIPAASSKTSSDEKLIVRAKVGISAGEAADITKFEMVSVPARLIPPNAVYSISELKDKRIKNNICEKEMIMTADIIPLNAWYEDGDRLVEHNFTEGAIPASVAEGSLIDIKLFRQGEEDCVVISKAAVISRNASLLSFYLNAVEQENLKEASTEGVLFAVEYIDASQTASSITYILAYKKTGTNRASKD